MAARPAAGLTARESWTHPQTRVSADHSLRAQTLCGSQGNISLAGNLQPHSATVSATADIAVSCLHTPFVYLFPSCQLGPSSAEKPRKAYGGAAAATARAAMRRSTA